jgi:hypothetical protein
MAIRFDIESASAKEIQAHFEEYLAVSKVVNEDFSISSGLSAPLIEIWCWLRDDGQVEKTRSSLAVLTTLNGRARGLQFLKNVLIPDEILNKLRSALALHLPCLDIASGGANEWDDRLHPQYFSSFVDSIV